MVYRKTDLFTVQFNFFKASGKKWIIKFNSFIVKKYNNDADNVLKAKK